MIAIYIAGKFSGENAWEREQNIRAAETHALTLARSGVAPVCPHTMYRFFDGTMPYEKWMAICLELLERCNAIVLLPGWKDSKGACIEREHAMKLKMPIIDGEERNEQRQ